jgi:hypothetical protein
MLEISALMTFRYDVDVHACTTKPTFLITLNNNETEENKYSGTNL